MSLEVHSSLISIQYQALLDVDYLCVYCTFATCLKMHLQNNAKSTIKEKLNDY